MAGGWGGGGALQPVHSSTTGVAPGGRKGTGNNLVALKPLILDNGMFLLFVYLGSVCE